MIKAYIYTHFTVHPSKSFNAAFSFDRKGAPFRSSPTQSHLFTPNPYSNTDNTQFLQKVCSYRAEQNPLKPVRKERETDTERTFERPFAQPYISPDSRCLIETYWLRPLLGWQRHAGLCSLSLFLYNHHCLYVCIIIRTYTYLVV